VLYLHKLYLHVQEQRSAAQALREFTTPRHGPVEHPVPSLLIESVHLCAMPRQAVGAREGLAAGGAGVGAVSQYGQNRMKFTTRQRAFPCRCVRRRAMEDSVPLHQGPSVNGGGAQLAPDSPLSRQEPHGGAPVVPAASHGEPPRASGLWPPLLLACGVPVPSSRVRNGRSVAVLGGAPLSSPALTVLSTAHPVRALLWLCCFQCSSARRSTTPGPDTWGITLQEVQVGPLLDAVATSSPAQKPIQQQQ
jgi:hypothetical protein